MIIAFRTGLHSMLLLLYILRRALGYKVSAHSDCLSGDGLSVHIPRVQKLSHEIGGKKGSVFGYLGNILTLKF